LLQYSFYREKVLRSAQDDRCRLIHKLTTSPFPYFAELQVPYLGYTPKLAKFLAVSVKILTLFYATYQTF